MNIRPYVYRCEHKVTGEFYFGSRTANWLPAKEDLGIHYFTSSKIVSSNFKDYNYEILSEYDTNELAYKVEQNLIWNSRKDIKLINRNCKSGGFSDKFGEKYPNKKERHNNIPNGKIYCPIRPGVIINPADLNNIDYIKERIATTGSKKNLKKWCKLLEKLL